MTVFISTVFEDSFILTSSLQMRNQNPHLYKNLALTDPGVDGDNIKMDLQEVGWGNGLDLSGLV
jgi:hypothetical protein